MQTFKINITLNIDVEHEATDIKYDESILKPLLVALHNDNQLFKAAELAVAYRLAHSQEPEKMMNELWEIIEEFKNEKI